MKKVPSFECYGDFKAKKFVGNAAGLTNIVISNIPIATSSATGFILASTDKGKATLLTAATEITLTINTDSLTSVGDIAYFIQDNDGKVVPTAGAGVTLNYNEKFELKTNGINSEIFIKKTGVDTYLISGDLYAEAVAEASSLQTANWGISQEGDDLVYKNNGIITSRMLPNGALVREGFWTTISFSTTSTDGEINFRDLNDEAYYAQWVSTNGLVTKGDTFSKVFSKEAYLSFTGNIGVADFVLDYLSKTSGGSKVIDIDNNFITAIDISSQTNVEELDVSDNNLTTIDLSYNINLINVKLHHNSFSPTELDNILSDLNSFGNDNMYIIIDTGRTSASDADVAAIEARGGTVAGFEL